MAINVDPGAPDHRPRLYTRRIGGYELVEVSDSKGVLVHALSPDGQWLAFVAPLSARSSRYQIMKVPVDQSAPPIKIADWPEGARASLVWPTPEKLFGFRTRDNSLLPFSANGGPPGSPVAIRTDRKVRNHRDDKCHPDRLQQE